MVTLIKVMLRVIIIMDNDIQTTASLLFPSSLILLPLLTSATLSSLLASTLIALDKMVRPVEIFVFVLFIVVTYFFAKSISYYLGSVVSFYCSIVSSYRFGQYDEILYCCLLNVDIEAQEYTQLYLR